MTALKIYLGMKDEKACLYSHPIIQTFTAVGPGRADKEGDAGLPPLLVPGGGCLLLFPLSVPL